MANSFLLEAKFDGYEELHQFLGQFIAGEEDVILRGTATAIRQYSHWSYTLDMEGPDVVGSDRLPTAVINPVGVILSKAVLLDESEAVYDFSGNYRYKKGKPPLSSDIELSIGNLLYTLDETITSADGENGLLISPDAIAKSDITGVTFESILGGGIIGVVPLSVTTVL